MPEDNNCKLMQTSRSSDNKKKKKKKKKRKTANASTTPPCNTDKPQVVSLPPETSPVSLLPPLSPGQPRAQLPMLRATSKKDEDLLTGSARKRKKHPKGSPVLLTATNKTSGSGELDTQARESLRWEGLLDDPQAEEKRMELYRANRRQRYIAHRDSLLKEPQGALRPTFPQGEQREKGFD